MCIRDRLLLDPGTYYWKIVPKNEGGSAAGCPVWKFTVGDTEDPVFTKCQNDIVVNNEPSKCYRTLLVGIDYFVSVNDNCALDPNDGLVLDFGGPNNHQFPVGITPIQYTGMDESGNTSVCAFSITVNDTQKPAILCQGDIVKNTDPNVCTAWSVYVQPQVSDNCGIESVTQTSGLPSGCLLYTSRCV